MRAVWAGLACLLASCSGFRSSEPATQAYVLRAPAPAAQSAPAHSVTLRVLRPLPGPGLDTEHIMLLDPDRTFRYYAGSSWAAPLPEVVQALVVETLRGSGAFSAVSDSRSAFPADYMLQISVRRFEADYSAGSGAPVVQVSLECMLARRSDRGLVATFAAESSATASENRMSAVVAAFEQAAGAALASVAERSAAAVRTSTDRSPP
jgi:cholesterol transport system auxiliary component